MLVLWILLFIFRVTSCYDLEIDLDNEKIWISQFNQPKSEIVSLSEAGYNPFYKVNYSFNNLDIQVEEGNKVIQISFLVYQLQTGLKTIKFYTSDIMQKQELISSFIKNGAYKENEEIYKIFDNYEIAIYFDIPKKQPSIATREEPEECQITFFDLMIFENKIYEGIDITCSSFIFSISDRQCEDYEFYHFTPFIIEFVNTKITSESSILFELCTGVDLILTNCELYATDIDIVYKENYSSFNVKIRSSVAVEADNLTILGDTIEVLANSHFITTRSLYIEGSEFSIRKSRIESGIDASIIGRGGLQIDEDTELIFTDGSGEITGISNCFGVESYGHITISGFSLTITGGLRTVCMDSPLIAVYLENTIIMERSNSFLEIIAEYSAGEGGVEDPSNVPLHGIWLKDFYVNGLNCDGCEIELHSEIPLHVDTSDYSTAIILDNVALLGSFDNVAVTGIMETMFFDSFGKNRCFYISNIVNFNDAVFQCTINSDSIFSFEEMIGFEVLSTVIANPTFSISAPNLNHVIKLVGFKFFNTIFNNATIETDSFGCSDCTEITVVYSTFRNFHSNCLFDIEISTDVIEKLIMIDISNGNSIVGSSFIATVSGENIIDLTGVQIENSDFEDSDINCSFGLFDCDYVKGIKTSYSSFKNAIEFDSYIDCGNICSNIISVDIMQNSLEDTDIYSTIIAPSSYANPIIGIQISGVNTFDEIYLSSSFEFNDEREENSTGILIMGTITYINFSLEAGEANAIRFSPKNGILILSPITCVTPNSDLELYSYGVNNGIIIQGIIDAEGSIYLEGSGAINDILIENYIDFKDLTLKSFAIPINVKYLHNFQPKNNCNLDVLSSITFENGIQITGVDCYISFLEIVDGNNIEIDNSGPNSEIILYEVRQVENLLIIDNASEVHLRGNIFATGNIEINSLIFLSGAQQINSTDGNVKCFNEILNEDDTINTNNQLIIMGREIYLLEVRKNKFSINM